MSTTRTLLPKISVTPPSAPASLKVHFCLLPVPIQLRDTPVYDVHLVLWHICVAPDHGLRLQGLDGLASILFCLTSVRKCANKVRGGATRRYVGAAEKSARRSVYSRGKEVCVEIRMCGTVFGVDQGFSPLRMGR